MTVIKKISEISVGTDMKKKDSWCICTLVQPLMKNSMNIPQKIKNRTTI